MAFHLAIWIVAALLVVVAAWLFAGKRIAPVIDACFPRTPVPRAIDPMSIQFDPSGIGSYFSLGSQGWAFSWPTAPGPLELNVGCDENGRLVLHADGRSFTFGPIKTRWNDPAKPTYEFAPEDGDVVSFTRTIGTLPWPTPFEISWLGGTTPKMKRFIYDRLIWTKASGARLEVLWRGQEWYYRGTGWVDTWNNRLTRVVVRDGKGDHQGVRPIVAHP